MERQMRTTIDSDKLDITEWQGKRQRLQTRIGKEMYHRHLSDTLPHRLIMTLAQYEMMKRSPELGSKGEWEHYPPNYRIYNTAYNAMEVEIK